MRHYFPVFAVLGGVLMLFSMAMLVPLGFAWFGRRCRALGLRRGARHHLHLRRAAVLHLPPRAARTAAARRLPAGLAGLDRAAGLRHAAAAPPHPGAVGHRRVLRSRVRDDDDRRDRAHRPRQAARVDQRLALLHGADRGHGHPRARRRDPAAARRRRQPGVQGRDAGADEGREAHAADRRAPRAACGPSTSSSRWPACSPIAGPGWAGPTRSCTCARRWGSAASPPTTRRSPPSTRRRSRRSPSSSCCWPGSTSRSTSSSGGSARCARCGATPRRARTSR